MTQKTLEIAGRTLEEAREQLESRIPEGFLILSEQVISEGKPQTVKASAETTEAAFAKAQKDIPGDADIVVKRELAVPERRVIGLEASDERNAESTARFQASREFGDTAILKSIKLVVAGSKGFLGIGGRPNQYQVEILREAAVEITYRPKARISIKLSDEKELKSLITALRHEDKTTRQNAARSLDALGWRPRKNADGAAYWATTQYWGHCIDVGEPAIGPLVIALQDKDKPMHEGAIFALEALGWRPGQDRAAAAYWIIKKDWSKCVGIGAPALEPLIVALQDGDKEVRAAAAKALGDLKDPRAIEPLIAALRDGDKEVRAAAAKALGNLQDPQAIAPLFGIYKEATFTDNSLRAVVIAALGQIGGMQVVEPLVRSMRYGNRELREAATEELGKIKEWQPAEDELSAIYWIGRGEIERCGAVGSPAVPPLIDILTNLSMSGGKYLKSSCSTLSAVAEALGQIGDPRAVEPLVNTLYTLRFAPGLHDHEEETQKSLVAALGKIKEWQPAKDELSARYWIGRGEINSCVTVGPPAVPLLLKVYQEVPWYRSIVAGVLGIIGDPRAVEPLIIALQDKGDSPGDNRLLRHAAAQALGNIGDEHALQGLITILKLGTNDTAVDRWIGDALCQIGEPAVLPLIDSLKSPSAFYTAIQSLGRIGDRRAVEPLIDALQDKTRPDFRSTAAEALGAIGDPRAVDPLIEILRRQDYDFVMPASQADGTITDPRALEHCAEYGLAIAAAKALGRIGDARAVEALLGTLYVRKLDAGSSLGEAVIAALVEIGGPRQLKPLVDDLRNSDDEVRLKAADKLCKIGDASAVEPLIAALHDKSSSVRIAAARALGEIGDPRAVEPVTKLLGDQDGWVGLAAAEVLGKIGNAEAVEPLIFALQGGTLGFREAAAEALRQIRRR